jgi:hypothetical protein
MASESGSERQQLAPMLSDVEMLLEEIAQLAWSVRMHCEVIERYAGLGHLQGIDLAAKDARSCLVALIETRKGLRYAERG